MQQQFANILSNGISFAPSNDNGSNHGHVYGKPIHARSAPSGFTVLQGHIQLMAMVPTLPENQLSPRVRAQDSFPKIQPQSQRPTPPLEFSPPHITRMMPSATKFKPAQLMPQSSFAPYASHPPVRELPQLPELSLPPKPGKPIAMPSFGRHLHSAHRLVSRETFVQYSSSQHQSQPTVQHPTQSHQQTYSNPFPQSSQSPFPPFANASMSYQMVNFVPQTPQYESPRRNGSGDFSPMLFQFQQQQQQQQQQQSMQPTYELPYNTFPPKSPIKNQIQYVQYPIGYPHHQQPQHHHVSQTPQQPYAAQSVPCFGTVYGQQIPQPMCSASMPQICVGSQQSSMPPSPTPLVRMPPIHHHHQNQSLPVRTQTVTLSVHPSQSKSQGVKNGACVMTNKNLSDSGSGSDFELEPSKKKNKNATRVVSRVSQLIVPPQPDEHLCQQINQAKSTLDSARFRTLGPDSNPTRIPSKPKVVHSQTKLQQTDWNNECKENQSCASCKKCLSKLKPPPQHSDGVSSDDQDFRIKVRKLSNDLTPRMKPKPVVVALHDCFPSDSSVSDANCSDVEVTTTSPRRPALSNGPFLRGKRRPRLESIYKIKNKRGDPSEEVFDVLHDLNPDEARTFNCEYLVELLSSSDWSQCHLGLETMVRLARHRPKTLLNYLGPILWYAFNHLTSPKSALCRAAIVTFTELFQRIGSALDNDLEKLTEKLVVKSLAPNMFIRQECDKALEAMVNHCSLLKVLGAIEHVSKKSHVRAICPRIANMTRQFIKVAGVDTCLKPMYAEKILPMLFTFMTVANNETRSAAKQALAMLMNHLQFEAAVTKHVTFDRNCTEVFKKLDKMRGRNRNRSCGGITRPYPTSRQFKK